MDRPHPAPPEPPIGRSAGPIQPALDRRLRERADGAGRLRFDRFMEIALYDPDGGYYRRTDRRFGRTGDFYTAPGVAPLFGQALAERLIAAWRAQGAPRRYRIVELGPGDGTLARDILGHLARRLPASADGFEYLLWERSPIRGEEARRRAADAAGAVRLRVAAPTGPEAPFTGAVIANEVLDAQPCRRFVAREGRWLERFVDLATMQLTELPAEPAPGPAPSEEGDELEVAPGAVALIRTVADLLADGLALIIDYGAPEGNAGRPTFQTARDHRAGGDPLTAPGTQDLSAWVDFPRVRSAARQAGLTEIAFRSQAEALTAWGLAERAAEWGRTAADPVEQVRRHLAVKNLLFGFANFRVLELATGTLARRWSPGDAALPAGVPTRAEP
ncbi:MAG: class I SAM-dependent methyltransferase [Thermoplasmata archaeon]